MTAVFPNKGAIMSNAADQSNKMRAELTHSLDNMEVNSDLDASCCCGMLVTIR